LLPLMLLLQPRVEVHARLILLDRCAKRPTMKGTAANMPIGEHAQPTLEQFLPLHPPALRLPAHSQEATGGPLQGRRSASHLPSQHPLRDERPEDILEDRSHDPARFC